MFLWAFVEIDKVVTLSGWHFVQNADAVVLFSYSVWLPAKRPDAVIIIRPNTMPAAIVIRMGFDSVP